MTAPARPGVAPARRGTAFALLLAALAAWAVLAWAALEADHPVARLMMPMTASWGAANVASVFVMWSVMMAAMMLPSAAPMAATFAALSARKNERARTWAFVAAYLAIWTGFSVAGAGLQWSLQAAGAISPMIASNSPWLTGGLLLIAGAYQFTPLKHACLAQCRTPLGFLVTDWRGGLAGAWGMGLRHGLYCLGCCWALMALLFVGGVMNLAWVAALSAAVAMEKLVPGGHRIGSVLGAVLIAGGVLKLAG